MQKETVTMGELVEVPPHLKPDEPEQTVAVELAGDRVVTDAQADNAATILKVPLLTAEELKALRDLGIYTGGNISIQISRGRMLVTQKNLAKFLDRLLDIAQNSGDDQVSISASQAASSLFGKVIEAEKHVAELHNADDVKKPAGKNRNRSFIPGQDAPLNLAVQINNNPPSSEKPVIPA
jgi:hypothetical protein